MASNYIQVPTTTTNANSLLSLVGRTLDVAEDLAQMKKQMDSILGNPVDYSLLAVNLGFTGDTAVAKATALYNYVVAAKTAISDNASVGLFTANIGQ